MNPHELCTWLEAFARDGMYAFQACPNDVYSELRRFGYIDVEHDVTDKGHDWLVKYSEWQAYSNSLRLQTEGCHAV